MVESPHERIVDIVMDLAREFAEMVVGQLPEETPVTQTRGADLTESTPKQLLADGTIVVGDPPTFGLIVEVQTSMSKSDYVEKTYKWPHYAMGLRTQLRCPTDTLVVTIDARIEKRARTPLTVGAHNTWVPMVIGPSTLPSHPTVEFARRFPGAAILSVMANGSTYTDPQTPAHVLLGMWESTEYQALEKDIQGKYYDMVLSALPLSIAQSMRDDAMTQQYYSPVVLEVLERGIQQGIEQGIEQGIASGRLDGLRESVRYLLELRGHVLTQEDAARLDNEHDETTLRLLIKTAASITPGEALFKPH
ncbi:MAG: hypothetical protein R3E66_06365 [bacterium]